MKDIKQKESSNPIILWGASISPYVRKVKIALKEKGLTYQQQEILPKVLLNAIGEKVPTEFEKISPLGKIPAIQIGDFFTADSAVIAGYLDAKFPERPLLYPPNPEEKAEAIWFEHYSDTVLTEVAYKKIFLENVVKPNVLKIEANTEMVKSTQEEALPLLLNYLNQSLEGKNWFAGETFSMADIAITTQILALKMADFDLDSKKWNHLERHLNQALSRASFNQI